MSLGFLDANSQLLIAPITLYSFMVGGLISVVWCLFLFSLALIRPTPQTSFFSEIDLLPKCAAGRFLSTDSFQGMLSRLHSSTTCQITRELAGSMFHVQATSPSCDHGGGLSNPITFMEGKNVDNMEF
jgi:hypothetical protein